MIRRTSLGLGGALLFLACGACDHAGQPVTETQAAPQSPPAVTTTAESTPSSPAPPAAPPTEETAIAEAKPATGGPAPPTGAPVPGDANEIRRVTVEETNALRESGKGVIVDVRDEASYNLGHIAGALHIPGDQLAKRLGELPRDKPIVTYCAWHQEATSARAALLLQQNGFTEAVTLLGGIAAWRQAGLPTEP